MTSCQTRAFHSMALLCCRRADFLPFDLNLPVISQSASWFPSSTLIFPSGRWPCSLGLFGRELGERPGGQRAITAGPCLLCPWRRRGGEDVPSLPRRIKHGHAVPSADPATKGDAGRSSMQGSAALQTSEQAAKPPASLPALCRQGRERTFLSTDKLLLITALGAAV